MISFSMTRERTLSGTFILMRRALGHSLADNEFESLSLVNAKQLVRLTSAHSIANLIAKTFEDADISVFFEADLQDFLLHLRKKNRERNVAIRRQIIDAANILKSEGIPVVALKGAAELMAPLYPDLADRFLSDIDLLVPEQQIDDAIRALIDNGYSNNRSDGRAWFDRADRHALALWRAGELTGIELHKAPSSERLSAILPAQAVIERSVPTIHDCLRTPSLADRLCHLVSHAQIDHFRYNAYWLLLRDVADFSVFQKHINAEIVDAVGARFARAYQYDLFCGFAAAASTVLGEAVPEKWQGGAMWARRTIRLLANPGHHRRNILRAIINYCIGRLTSDKAARAQFLSNLFSPSRIWQFLTRNMAAFKNLQ